MKPNVDSLSVDTLKMFFEIKTEGAIKRIDQYSIVPKYKSFRSTLKDMRNDCNIIINAKIPDNCEKTFLVSLYKRLEEAITFFEKQGIDNNLKVIATEIKKIKAEIVLLKSSEQHSNTFAN